MTRAAFSQKVVAESTELVCVYLRNGVKAVQQKRGEIILNLNRSGNWVPGLEIVGGFVPFSIEKAVRPFEPVMPEPSARWPGTVTYDPQADAAFIYLEYDSRFAQLTPQEQVELKTVSYSVNPTATYGLDDQGGLVWVKIPVADLAGSVDQFLQLLRR
ncbi:MAG: hypothetical protein ACHQLQ_12740 [Candidatus Acidiferrales bacterium]